MNDQLVNLIGVVTIAVVAALVRVGVQWVQARIAPGKLQAVASLAQVAVDAADKALDNANVTGEEKYAYAETALTSLAKRVGVKLKPEEANALIHSVLEQYNKLSTQVSDDFVNGYQQAMAEAQQFLNQPPTQTDDQGGELPDVA